MAYSSSESESSQETGTSMPWPSIQLSSEVFQNQTFLLRELLVTDARLSTCHGNYSTSYLVIKESCWNAAGAPSWPQACTPLMRLRPWWSI